MRDVPKIRAWGVYETVIGTHAGMRFVYTEDDWKMVESRDQGKNRIVKGGIVDENEAEKLARGTSGDAKVRTGAVRPKFQ